MSCTWQSLVTIRVDLNDQSQLTATMIMAIAPTRTVMQNPMAPVEVAPLLSGLLLGTVTSGGGAAVEAEAAPVLSALVDVFGSSVMVVWLRVLEVDLAIGNEDRLAPIVLHS